MDRELHAGNSALPGINMSMESPPTFGFNRPPAMDSQLDLGMLADFGDLALDDDNFEPTCAPAMPAALTPPRSCTALKDWGDLALDAHGVIHMSPLRASTAAAPLHHEALLAASGPAPSDAELIHATSTPFELGAVYDNAASPFSISKLLNVGPGSPVSRGSLHANWGDLALDDNGVVHKSPLRASTAAPPAHKTAPFAAPCSPTSGGVAVWAIRKTAGHSASTPFKLGAQRNNTASPYSLSGMSSPLTMESPLSISDVENTVDLLLDADGVVHMTPARALVAYSPPHNATPLARWPSSGGTAAWAIGHTPTKASDSGSTPPQRNDAHATVLDFSPLPLVGCLAAQRLPTDYALPAVCFESPLLLIEAAPLARPSAGESIVCTTRMLMSARSGLTLTFIPMC